MLQLNISNFIGSAHADQGLAALLMDTTQAFYFPVRDSILIYLCILKQHFVFGGPTLSRELDVSFYPRPSLNECFWLHGEVFPHPRQVQV